MSATPRTHTRQNPQPHTRQSSQPENRQEPRPESRQPRAANRLRTEVPGPQSRARQARRAEAVAAGVAVALPAYVARSGGAGLLVDVDGNELIDLGSGIAVTSVGNPAPAVAEAVRAQVELFTHTCFMISPYDGYVEVCEELNRRTPGDHAKRSALFSSGAEAVENAVKIARYATGRPAVVVLDHAYHGRTNLTLALTAKNMPYKHRFGPFAGEVYRVPTSYPFRDPAGMTGAEAAARATGLVDTQVGAENVAALVVEPIQGEGGFVVPAPGFLPALAAWCARYGVLLVADEIQTGFCRTGAWFAMEHEQAPGHEAVVPDLVTTAKGMAGGLPLAGVTGRAEVMDAVHPGGLGGTYGGNPVACAAALATIATMADQDLAGAARRIESATLPRLRELATRASAIGDVRGRGAMLAIELARPGTVEPDPELARRVAAACHRAGVVVLTCGTYGNVIRLLPPLVIPPSLLDEGLTILEEAVLEEAVPDLA